MAKDTKTPKDSNKIIAFNIENILKMLRPLANEKMRKFKDANSDEQSVDISSYNKMSKDDYANYVMMAASEETRQKLFKYWKAEVLTDKDNYQSVFVRGQEYSMRNFLVGKGNSWAKYLNNTDSNGCTQKVIESILIAFGINKANSGINIDNEEDYGIENEEVHYFFGEFYSGYHYLLKTCYLKIFPRLSKVEFHRLSENNGQIIKSHSYYGTINNERCITLLDCDQKQTYMMALCACDPINEKKILEFSISYTLDYRPLGSEGSKFEYSNRAFLKKTEIKDEKKDIEEIYKNRKPNRRRLAELSGNILINEPYLKTDRTEEYINDVLIDINGTYKLYQVPSSITGRASKPISIFKLEITENLEIKLYDVDGGSRAGYFVKHPTNSDTVTLRFEPRPDIKATNELILIIFSKNSSEGVMTQTRNGLPYSERIYIQKTENKVISERIGLEDFSKSFIENLDKDTVEDILENLNKSLDFQTNIKDMFAENI